MPRTGPVLLTGPMPLTGPAAAPSLPFDVLFEASAWRRPGAVALRSGSDEVSYGALNARAHRLAHRLIAFGVGPEDVVAAALDRSAELIVAVLAVLKTGAAVLSVDIGCPAARLATVLTDARPELLLTVPHIDLPETPALTRSNLPAPEGAHDVRPAHLAYVIHTSGSTGTPKPVAVTRVLDPEPTAAVLTQVPTALGTGVNAALLAALGRAVAAWRTAHIPGDPAAVRDAPFLVDVEGHGREEIAEDLDLAHTVGWFTSMFPVRLEPGDTPDAVQRRLDRTPDKGLGFGLLRYLDPETEPVLARLAGRQILFNYLGRFDRSPDADWSPAPEGPAVGSGGDPGMPLTHLLEVSAVTLDGGTGPERVTRTFPRRLLTRHQVGELADAWFAALRYLAEPA